MSIELTCICGKKLTVPDDAAGKRARCPECNAVVPVPGVAKEPPPPEPEPSTATGRVDQMMDTFIADLAKSRERAPELTQIAVGLLSWSGFSFLFMFFAATFSTDGRVILWLLIDVPMAAVGAAIGIATIKCWPKTPALVDFLMPVVFGAAYVLFWQATLSVAGWGFAYFFNAIVWLGGSAFLYWYFRWHGAAKLFAEDPEALRGEPEAVAPAPADNEKGKSST